MTSQPWSRVAPIVDAALLRDEQARPAFVADACGNDADLIREVESLLAHASDDADFLNTPAVAMAPSLWSERPLTTTTLPTSDGPGETPTGASRLAPGQQVGLYRIERLLGRGGMGEVYVAEHVEHGRRIALKVLSPRLSDAIDRAQFLREGQLAAAVNHPHVVYIYGSEDIGGMPVIAMELLPGGTLKERVEKEGPQAPIEAVDAIVQVISGLEAAHEAGVLHRDIKPSNCFVDADGTVKVGDFGLAIPALEGTLAALGTIQGTPQFASPEQLRGQPLDVTSDIYAVGATLYYLLTGRPPFNDRDVMDLVSRIETESPTSPRQLRPEVPRAVAAVVLQCLAKSPADRPASYRELATALEPFGSTVKTPASLGMRTAARAFDSFFSIVFPVNILLGTFVVLARPSSVFDAKPVLITVVAVSYFAITEGVWGASLGKALCGCRVVTESGAPPGFARALVRALIFVLPARLASAGFLSLAGFVYSMQGPSAVVAIVVEAVVQALLFVTARRANGFAGIHESASGTRTVLKSPVVVRGLVRPAVGPTEVPAGSRRVGPYRILDTSSSPANCGAALGYDDRLRRTVWLRFTGADVDPVPHVRRIVRRPSRPRWLAGQRDSGLAWDAYEQVPGQPFSTLLTHARSWETVRGWLCDLAQEMQAGLGDGSLPALDLDRIWIGNDGRAWLLDWPARNDRTDLAGSPPNRSVDLAQAEGFLYRVAVSALQGHEVANSHPHVLPQMRLPLPATDCLAKLGEHGFTASGEMLAAVKSAARGPAAISRARRAVHLSLCAVPTMLMLVIGALSVYNRVVSAHPHVRSVRAGEAADRAGVEADDMVVAVDGESITFASQLSDAVSTHPDQSITLSIVRGGQLLELSATPTRRADQGQLGIMIADATPEVSHRVTLQYLWLQTVAGLMVAATLGLLSGLAGRGGIALHLMSIAVVTRNGALASGARRRLRAVLSWFPVLAASAAALAGQSPLLTLTPQAAQFLVVGPLDLPIFLANEPSIPLIRLAISMAAPVIFAFAAVFALISPERGLQDRLAGTWLVPY